MTGPMVRADGVRKRFGARGGSAFLLGQVVDDHLGVRGQRPSPVEQFLHGKLEVVRGVALGRFARHLETKHRWRPATRSGGFN